MEKNEICAIEYHLICFRCNQTICDFADSIYPSFPKTISHSNNTTGHDGLFVISLSQVGEYMRLYSPQILRYDKKTNCLDYKALNFGASKGLTFERVLIFPNGPVKNLLKTGDFQHVIKSGSKLYVAITRAKHSVAFVYDNACSLGKVERWLQSSGNSGDSIPSYPIKNLITNSD